MVVETRSSLRATTEMTTESLIRASFISSLHQQQQQQQQHSNNTQLLTPPRLHSEPPHLVDAITPDTATLSTERGPRYGAYSKLRESKLRRKFSIPEDEEEEDPIPAYDNSPVISTVTAPKMMESTTPSPLKKSVRFEGERLPSGGQKRIMSTMIKSGSIVAQSVPDFSAALRKENRRPNVNRIERAAGQGTTPVRSSKVFGSGVKKGSKSVNSGEKRGTGGGGGGGCGSVGRMGMARKSYASVEELKGLSVVAAAAIAGENRGGRGGGRMVIGRSSVLGLRQCY